MEQLRRTFTASATGLRNSDPLYLQVEMIVCSTASNLNGVRVTPAFISDIVSNSQRYVGIPLSADVNRIKIGDLRRLGHMYNERTGQFSSTQIGSLVQFSELNREEQLCLTSVARVPRRHKAVCEAMEQLYASGNLNFSFEVTAGDYGEDPDGTIVIDVSPNNFLDGLAIVTYPAYPEAKALRLVAQILNGGNDMNESEVQAEVAVSENEAVAEAETSAEVKAEENVSEAVEAQAEQEVAACNPEDKPAEEEAECKNAEDENASCNKQCEVEDVPQEDAECKPQAAEVPPAPCPCEPAPAPEQPKEDWRSCLQRAEELVSKLAERVASLETVVAELKAPKAEVIASENEHNEIVENPFVAEINIKSSKYSLLNSKEKEEQKSYSLL